MHLTGEQRNTPNVGALVFHARRFSFYLIKRRDVSCWLFNDQITLPARACFGEIQITLSTPMTLRNTVSQVIRVESKAGVNTARSE